MPTSSPSRSLRIKSFRGAPKDLTFVFDHRRPLTLIYGENGSGKTTICDAYDFIANKRVGSLADRGLGQLHPYWATSGKSGTDIVVGGSASFGATESSGTRSSRPSPVM